MKKWEYLTVIANNWGHARHFELHPLYINGVANSEINVISLYDYLSQLGKEGWEMVSAPTAFDNSKIPVYTFKREIE